MSRVAFRITQSIEVLELRSTRTPTGSNPKVQFTPAAEEEMQQGQIQCHTWAAPEWSANYGGSKAKGDWLRIAVQSLGASVSDVSDGSERRVLSVPERCNVVLLQHPTRGITAPSRSGTSIPFEQFMTTWTELRQWKIIVFHDLKSVQMGLFSGAKIELPGVEWGGRERRLAETASVIIVHTEAMAAMIREMYPLASARMVSLGLFDYLCDPRGGTIGGISSCSFNARPIRIAFCGNLNASSLFDELVKVLPQSPSIEYHLFSPSWAIPKQVIRRDVVMHLEEDASKLPGVLRELECRFGLCWWAETIMKSGYLRVIAPHKASCYLAAGIPLIAPAGTYLGDLAMTQGLGITIASLAEIATSVLSMPAEELLGMFASVAACSDRVCSGYYTRSALLASLP